MSSLFRFFLTWWGTILLAALDSSMLFFLPFGIDAVVIYLTARDDWFWIYPLLATAGSTAGAAITFWIGEKAGEHGLERFVSARRLERMRCRVRDSGAIALAVPALLPPPFPLTPFILTCGALAVNRWRFFLTFSAMRLFRFSVETALARRYGRGILRVLQSDAFQMIVIAFIVIAVLGTVISAVLLWRSTRRPHLRPA